MKERCGWPTAKGSPCTRVNQSGSCAAHAKHREDALWKLSHKGTLAALAGVELLRLPAARTFTVHMEVLRWDVGQSDLSAQQVFELIDDAAKGSRFRTVWQRYRSLVASNMVSQCPAI